MKVYSSLDVLQGIFFSAVARVRHPDFVILLRLLFPQRARAAMSDRLSLLFSQFSGDLKLLKVRGTGDIGSLQSLGAGCQGRACERAREGGGKRKRAEVWESMFSNTCWSTGPNQFARVIF